MESPWIRIFCICTILYYNRIVYGQNVPAGLPQHLQLRNKEVNGPVGTSQLLNTVLSTSANGLPDMIARTGVPELQDGFVSPPLPPLSIPPQIRPPLQLPPPILNSYPQGPLGSVSLSPQYPIQGPPTILPQSLALPNVPPVVHELPAVSCPPLALGNPIPFQPPQTSIDNLPSPILPNVCLQPANLQQNLPLPRPTINPIQQPQVQLLDSFPKAPSLPKVCPPLSALQMPTNYPINLQPGTAAIIPNIPPQYSAPSGNVMSVLPDMNVAQPSYQVTVLPPAPQIQTTSESVAYPSSYTNTPVTYGTDTSVQSPINLQIIPLEQPAPLPMPPQPFPPPYTMPPIIVLKSGSSWKNWLPTLLVTLFSNCRGRGCGGCCCSSCDSPGNVYLPFPIPVPTNNPVIVKGNSRNDDTGDGDEEYDDCED